MGQKAYTNRSMTVIKPLAVGCFVITVIILFYLAIRPDDVTRQQALRNETELKRRPGSPPPQQNTSNPTDTPLPPFIPGPVQARKQFDISKWNTYENQEVGLRFKYPPDWGIPGNDMYKHCQEWVDNCKEIIGYRFSINFSQSYVKIGGTSGHVTEGSEWSPTVFGGFNGNDPNSYCDYTGFDIPPVTIFCQVVYPRVDVLWVSGPLGNIEPYRIMYIDAPNNLVKGFGFMAPFLTEEMSQRKFSMNDKELDTFREALLARRLDSESMRNFDEIEKVYETVEVF